MTQRIEATRKKTIVAPWENSQKFWMSEIEYTGVVVGKEATDSEYVISDGSIAPGGFIPDHYHKWEDQIFHILESELEAKVGDQIVKVDIGDPPAAGTYRCHHRYVCGWRADARLGFDGQQSSGVVRNPEHACRLGSEPCGEHPLRTDRPGSSGGRRRVLQ